MKKFLSILLTIAMIASMSIVSMAAEVTIADADALVTALGNAVNDGGTVKLITRELGDHILIIVEDTGVGFDPEKKKDDGRSHLGLENVKRRISMMSKGEMDIISAIGEGTIITLKLPKKL